ncbi:MAG TPA: hypothetical protein VHZ53_00965 [Steroidobacteraceae bacterium]|jgi:hypothetical protein|nr:hypothetical protein [Steroidobacteraceae bacterium]
MPQIASARYLRFGLNESRERRRSVLIERLLARAEPAALTRDWRRDAFEVIAADGAPMPGVAPCAWWAEQARMGIRPAAAGATGLPGTRVSGAARAGTVLLATPVEYLAEMSNVRLADTGILAVAPEEATALAADFGRVLGDGETRLAAAPSGRLFCMHNREIVGTTCDPQSAAGRHIQEFLPSGRDGAPLRRLMSEMEMWLYEHEVNRRRTAAGLPVVSGLWLWGGGPQLESLPPTHGSAAGDDPLFDAFQVSATAARGDAAVMAVAAQPGGAAWRELDACWLEPTLAALEAGRVAELRLSAGQRSFRLTGRGLRRFWRRPRPWWEHFT